MKFVSAEEFDKLPAGTMFVEARRDSNGEWDTQVDGEINIKVLRESKYRAFGTGPINGYCGIDAFEVFEGSIHWAGNRDGDPIPYVSYGDYPQKHVRYGIYERDDMVRMIALFTRCLDAVDNDYNGLPGSEFKADGSQVGCEDRS